MTTVADYLALVDLVSTPEGKCRAINPDFQPQYKWPRKDFYPPGVVGFTRWLNACYVERVISFQELVTFEALFHQGEIEWRGECYRPDLYRTRRASCKHHCPECKREVLYPGVCVVCCLP